MRLEMTITQTACSLHQAEVELQLRKAHLTALDSSNEATAARLKRKIGTSRSALTAAKSSGESRAQQQKESVTKAGSEITRINSQLQALEAKLAAYPASDKSRGIEIARSEEEQLEELRAESAAAVGSLAHLLPHNAEVGSSELGIALAVATANETRKRTILEDLATTMEELMRESAT